MPGLTEQPVTDGGRSSGRVATVLELRLLSSSLIFRDMREFRRALRHRYVLANFAGLTIPGIVLLYALDNTRMPIDLQVPAVVVGLITVQVLVIAYLTCAVWVVRMIRKDDRIIRIWVTPGLMLGAAGMLATVHMMHQAMDVQQDWTEVRSRLIPFLCVLYLELAASLVFRGPMPRALSKLRAGAEPLPDFAEAVAGPGDRVTEANTPVMGQDAPPPGGDLMIRLGIGADDILRLEASGNYVTVVTRKGRELVPGPFSAVVAQMPPMLGRQVQRSHWVALDAIEGVKRQGRDVWLHMACGALVPVSAAQKSEVLGWLALQGKVGRAALRETPSRRAGAR